MSISDSLESENEFDEYDLQPVQSGLKEDRRIRSQVLGNRRPPRLAKSRQSSDNHQNSRGDSNYQRNRQGNRHLLSNRENDHRQGGVMEITAGNSEEHDKNSKKRKKSSIATSIHQRQSDADHKSKKEGFEPDWLQKLKLNGYKRQSNSSLQKDQNDQYSQVQSLKKRQSGSKGKPNLHRRRSSNVFEDEDRYRMAADERYTRSQTNPFSLTDIYKFNKKKEEPDLKSQRSINQRIHSNIKNNIRTCTHFGDFNREHSFEADCKEKSKESDSSYKFPINKSPEKSKPKAKKCFTDTVSQIFDDLDRTLNNINDEFDSMSWDSEQSNSAKDNKAGSKAEFEATENPPGKIFRKNILNVFKNNYHSEDEPEEEEDGEGEGEEGKEQSEAGTSDRDKGQGLSHRMLERGGGSDLKGLDNGVTDKDYVDARGSLERDDKGGIKRGHTRGNGDEDDQDDGSQSAGDVREESNRGNNNNTETKRIYNNGDVEGQQSMAQKELGNKYRGRSRNETDLGREDYRSFDRTASDRELEQILKEKEDMMRFESQKLNKMFEVSDSEYRDSGVKDSEFSSEDHQIGFRNNNKGQILDFENLQENRIGEGNISTSRFEKMDKNKESNIPKNTNEKLDDEELDSDEIKDKLLILKKKRKTKKRTFSLDETKQLEKMEKLKEELRKEDTKWGIDFGGTLPQSEMFDFEGYESVEGEKPRMKNENVLITEMKAVVRKGFQKTTNLEKCQNEDLRNRKFNVKKHEIKTPNLNKNSKSELAKIKKLNIKSKAQNKNDKKMKPSLETVNNPIRRFEHIPKSLRRIPEIDQKFTRKHKANGMRYNSRSKAKSSILDDYIVSREDNGAVSQQRRSRKPIYGGMSNSRSRGRQIKTNRESKMTPDLKKISSVMNNDDYKNNHEKDQNNKSPERNKIPKLPAVGNSSSNPISQPVPRKCTYQSLCHNTLSSGPSPPLRRFHPKISESHTRYNQQKRTHATPQSHIPSELDIYQSTPNNRVDFFEGQEVTMDHEEFKKRIIGLQRGERGRVRDIGFYTRDSGGAGASGFGLGKSGVDTKLKRVSEREKRVLEEGQGWRECKDRRRDHGVEDPRRENRGQGSKGNARRVDYVVRRNPKQEEVYNLDHAGWDGQPQNVPDLEQYQTHNTRTHKDPLFKQNLNAFLNLKAATANANFGGELLKSGVSHYRRENLNLRRESYISEGFVETEPSQFLSRTRDTFVSIKRKSSNENETERRFEDFDEFEDHASRGHAERRYGQFGDFEERRMTAGNQGNIDGMFRKEPGNTRVENAGMDYYQRSRTLGSRAEVMSPNLNLNRDLKNESKRFFNSSQRQFGNSGNRCRGRSYLTEDKRDMQRGANGPPGSPFRRRNQPSTHSNNNNNPEHFKNFYSVNRYNERVLGQMNTRKQDTYGPSPGEGNMTSGRDEGNAQRRFFSHANNYIPKPTQTSPKSCLVSILHVYLSFWESYARLQGGLSRAQPDFKIWDFVVSLRLSKSNSQFLTESDIRELMLCLELPGDQARPIISFIRFRSKSKGTRPSRRIRRQTLSEFFAFEPQEGYLDRGNPLKSRNSVFSIVRSIFSLILETKNSILKIFAFGPPNIKLIAQIYSEFFKTGTTPDDEYAPNSTNRLNFIRYNPHNNNSQFNRKRPNRPSQRDIYAENNFFPISSGANPRPLLLSQTGKTESEESSFRNTLNSNQTEALSSQTGLPFPSLASNLISEGGLLRHFMKNYVIHSPSRSPIRSRASELNRLGERAKQGGDRGVAVDFRVFGSFLARCGGSWPEGVAKRAFYDISRGSFMFGREVFGGFLQSHF